MNAELEKKLELFVDNKQKIAKAFIIENELSYMMSSLILANENRQVDIEKMKEVRKILSTKAGVFSSLRDSMEMIMLAKMSLANNPEGYIDDVMEVYNKILGKRVIEYHSFVLGALSIVDLGKKSDADRIITKAWDILDRMKKEHPILADENDFTFTILLAMTDKDTDSIISEMEECYEYLKKDLKIKADSNAIQSLCEIIIMSDGDLKEKCDKAAAIFESFKEHKMKYGSYYEFASIGALIGLDIEKEELVETVIEVSAEMKKNKGFGIFTLYEKTRLMFAAMLVAQEVSDNKDLLYNYSVNGIVINNTVAMIVAEELAAIICSMAIAASNTASDAVIYTM